MEFQLPSPIRDFVFDLHQSTRKSLRLDEVTQSYELKYKELTEKYFAQSAWPESEAIASECSSDVQFLFFYKEMTSRHLFAKLKTTLADSIQSWATYNKLFDFILSSDGSPENDIMLTVQWVNDITQEFVYQFQGFCQYRSAIGQRNTEELKLLEQNREVWNLPAVMKILKGLVAMKSNSKLTGPLSVVAKYFACFASVELARLECLIGDYSSSLKWLSPSQLNVNDYRTSLIFSLTTCHINVYYHAGVSQLMLRRHVDALETFTEIALFLSTILKPAGGSGGGDKHEGGGGGKKGGGHSHSPLQKIMDKILSLLCIVISLCPGHRIDDQIKEILEGKFADKMRRLQSNDSASSLTTLTEMFENSCPKFVNAAVPNYSINENTNQEAFQNQVSIFAEEANQLLSVLKIRSYLKVYASIDIAKVARMSGVNEEQFFSQLISYKQKTKQLQSQKVSSTETTTTSSDPSVAQDSTNRVSTSDIDFTVADKVLHIQEIRKNSKNDNAERFFISAVRKHVEQSKDINRTFARYGL